MTAFRQKVEQLLNAGIIGRAHYDEARQFFDVKHKDPVRVRITPVLAELFLAMSPGNRFQPPANLASLIAQNRRGEFHDNAPPMGFNDKGDFKDGHGRCNAVLHGGRAIEGYVRFNLPDTSFVNIDSGAKRRESDDILFRTNFAKEFGTAPRQSDFSLLRYYLIGGNNPAGLDWRAIDVIARTKLIFALHDEFEFIKKYPISKGKAITNPVLAVFMRAYSANKEDRARVALALSWFTDEDKLNSANNTEAGVAIIRKLYSSNIAQKHRSGGQAEKEMYNRTANAMRDFLQGKEDAKITIKENNSFHIRPDIVEMAKNVCDFSTNHDFHLVPVLCRFARNKTGVFKASEMVAELIKLGYAKPERTVLSNIKKLFHGHKYLLPIPGYGKIIGDVDPEKLARGERVRCENYEVVRT